MPRAHPRSRGDHSGAAAPAAAGWGSSPLARGPLLIVRRRLRALGLIPARAGTTGTPQCSQSEFRAHPRSRGDHVDASPASAKEPGSSPLARGPRLEVCQGLEAVGLIPARAGTTGAMRGCRGRGRAHPRSRGDHWGQQGANDEPPGSSPLARGPHLLTWGFTPYISKIESL